MHIRGYIQPLRCNVHIVSFSPILEKEATKRFEFCSFKGPAAQYPGLSYSTAMNGCTLRSITDSLGKYIKMKRKYKRGMDIVISLSTVIEDQIIDNHPHLESQENANYNLPNTIKVTWHGIK